MRKLWSHRFSYYLKEIGKYGQLIFNDHFVLILLMLLAFAGIYYQDLLKQIQQLDANIVRLPAALFISLILGLVFHLGSPLWLTRDPDKSYLFPRGKEWHDYWLKGSIVSMFLPLFILMMVLSMLMPLMALTTSWGMEDFGVLLLFLIIFKLIAVIMEFLTIYALALNKDYQSSKGLMTFLFIGLIFISSLLMHPFNYSLLGLAVLFLLMHIGWGLNQSTKLWPNFEYVVEREEERQARFYRWVSIFAEVPQVRPSVKRRPYFDAWLGKFSFFNQDRYALLFSRALFRNNAFAGIWFRVMVFMAIMIILTQSPWLTLGLGLISHILTVIQLMPLLTYYQNNPFQQLYPEGKASLIKSFQKTILVILFLQSSVYGLVNLFNLGFSFTPLFNFILWLIMAIILVYAYVPWWFRKQV